MKNMHCYIVIYNLPSSVSDGDISRLHKALRTFESWGRITDSSWAILTSKSVVEIRDFLGDLIGSDSQLMVIKSGHEAAWRNVLASNDWLKSNLVH